MVSYNLFDHVDSNFRTIICFHIGWQGSVMIPTTQISPFHLLLRIVWMKTPTEQNLFSELANLATNILMSCKWQHCISDQICLSISILNDALSSAQCPHSMKTFISELFLWSEFSVSCDNCALIIIFPCCTKPLPGMSFKQTFLDWSMSFIKSRLVYQFWLEWQCFRQTNHFALVP